MNNREEWQQYPSTETDTEKQEPSNRMEKQNKENQKITHHKTTKQMLTQEDKLT